VALGRPDRLIRGGPYAFTRNPMYLVWTLGYGGIALAADAAWPLLLPGVLLATDVVVVREESALDRRFGVAYRSYAASVRRYL
jgi:protein-S-isoprenylcysteine O-methyltransferase Ste14